MERSVEASVECRQANLRIGEKGQPGAWGIWVSLRKVIIASIQRLRRFWSELDSAVGWVMSGLKIHICDSRCRERSAKMIV